jgi:predicted nucleic acid-binding protein
MTFGDIPSGARVFIDTNIFIYHFGGQSAECKSLLDRCARRELVGYTATFILAEALHRFMVAEAIQKGLVTGKAPVQKLADNPVLVKQLDQYNQNVKQIAQLNIFIVSLTPEIIAASEIVRQQQGLLTNDSLIVATMNNLGITNLISADEGFERIPSLQVFKPADL